MNRTTSYNKENPSRSLCQHTTTDFFPLAYKQKLLTSNLNVIENVTIESQSMLSKLKEKINLDQNKIQQNFLSLQQISQEVQQSYLQIASDKQIQNIIRHKKQFFKQSFAQTKSKNLSLKSRHVQQKEDLSLLIETKEKEIDQQKSQRQLVFSKIIDQFELQIHAIQKQFKSMRKESEIHSDGLQVLLYNLEQTGKENLERQKSARNSEHETIIRLIGECIENFRYIH